MRGLIGRVVRRDWVRYVSDSMTSGLLQQGLPQDKLNSDVKMEDQLDVWRRNGLVLRLHSFVKAACSALKLFPEGRALTS